MPYNFAAGSFCTKKLYSIVSSSEMLFYSENSHLAFLSLGATYTVHLRLIGKLVVDFLFVLIELFR